MAFIAYSFSFFPVLMSYLIASESFGLISKIGFLLISLPFAYYIYDLIGTYRDEYLAYRKTMYICFISTFYVMLFNSNQMFQLHLNIATFLSALFIIFYSKFFKERI